MDSNKDKIVREFIELKAEHQRTYFQLNETKKTNAILEKEIEQINDKMLKIQSEFDLYKENYQSQNETIMKLERENKVMVAQLKQLHRNSISVLEPEAVECEKNETENLESSNEYEVEELLKHRKRKGSIQYLVKWKNWPLSSATWEKENNLCCPHILKQYKQHHKI